MSAGRRRRRINPQPADCPNLPHRRPRPATTFLRAPATAPALLYLPPGRPLLRIPAPAALALCRKHRCVPHKDIPMPRERMDARKQPGGPGMAESGTSLGGGISFPSKALRTRTARASYAARKQASGDLFRQVIDSSEVLRGKRRRH